jgi:serine/threonine-protein kinase RsbW
MAAAEAIPVAADPVLEHRTIRLTIPARAEYITLGRLALTGLARLRDLPAETVGDIKLALTEACSNSVRHAYNGADGVVEILYELYSDRLVVEVVDDGPGFEPGEALGDDEAQLAEGGLGIAIIRALADELEIDAAGGGRGSRLRFVKFIAPPPAGNAGYDATSL